MSVDLGLKDCRSDAVPSRREKEKKVRYRNVKADLIGTERFVRDRNQAVWTEKNKYKMSEVCKPSRDSRHETGFHMAKKASTFRRDWQTPEDYTLPPAKTRKGQRSKRRAMTNSVHSELDDGTIPGVAYSFDAHSGPSYGANIFAHLVDQAEVKFENQVFDKFVKTEYEMVETTSEEDSDEEFELIDHDL